jgi:hypothetical protein
MCQTLKAREACELEYPREWTYLWREQSVKLEHGIYIISGTVCRALVRKYNAARASLRERAQAAAKDDAKLRELRSEFKALQSEASTFIERLADFATRGLLDVEAALGSDADIIIRVLNQ